MTDHTFRAELIYFTVYGSIDDKWFQNMKVDEILHWLNDGDVRGWTVGQIIQEWREYDADEIEAYGIL